MMNRNEKNFRLVPTSMKHSKDRDDRWVEVQRFDHTRWIPTSVKLPRQEGEYLVALKDPEEEEMTYHVFDFKKNKAIFWQDEDKDTHGARMGRFINGERVDPFGVAAWAKINDRNDGWAQELDQSWNSELAEA